MDFSTTGTFLASDMFWDVGLGGKGARFGEG